MLVFGRKSTISTKFYLILGNINPNFFPMKKLTYSLLAICTLTVLQVSAQIRTPSPSPGSVTKQTVGITDITVDYSRPSMKGREIFGKLLAYDKVWRTGANQATKIEFSTDAMFEGQKVPAGKYAIVSFPGQSETSVILTKDLGITEDAYKADKDFVKVKVRTTACPLTQSFTIDFSDVTDSTANLNFYWEKTKFAVKIETPTSSLVEKSIEVASASSSNQMTAGANYLLSKGKNLDKALTMINSAVSMGETFRNVWAKAQILAKLGNFAEALPLAKKAMDLGNTDTSGAFPFFKDAIQKGVEEYTSKIPAVVPMPGKKKK